MAGVGTVCSDVMCSLCPMRRWSTIQGALTLSLLVLAPPALSAPGQCDQPGVTGLGCLHGDASKAVVCPRDHYCSRQNCCFHCTSVTDVYCEKMPEEIVQRFPSCVEHCQISPEKLTEILQRLGRTTPGVSSPAPKVGNGTDPEIVLTNTTSLPPVVASSGLAQCSHWPCLEQGDQFIILITAIVIISLLFIAAVIIILRLLYTRGHTELNSSV